MRREKHHLKSTFFLLELVILLLFFGVCGGICAKLFAAADRMSRESEALSQAVVLAENAAEQLKRSDAQIIESLDSPDSSEAAWRREIYYDRDGNVTDNPDEEGYLLYIEGEQSSWLLTAEVVVVHCGKELYRLPADRALGVSGPAEGR